jgi:type IX secretion system PorP/SprF family membrane protein
MKKGLTIGCLLACAVMGYAQQRPIQSLYMFDPLLLNPAYAGSQVQLSATAIYRNQWVNFPGAPKTLTASVHSGFRKARVGVGLLAGKDQIGIHDETSLYMAYAYKLPLDKYSGSTLSFGLQGGFNHLRSDFTKLNPRDPDMYGVNRDFNWNFGAGLYYRTKKVWAGFSVPYILNNKVIEVENLQTAAQQFRYYYLMGGMTFEASPQLKFVPSALIRFQESAPLSFDANLVTVLYNVVGLGVSYRLNDSVIGMFELQLNENFHVGYAYDFTTSDIRLYSNGSHEIMINYRIRISKIHKGLECPAYW